MPPTISNATIRSLYELYGNDDYPVDQYCIGCQNCEHYSFPCSNCALYVFNGNLGAGNFGGPEPMDIDDDIIDVEMGDDDRIPSDSDSESEEYIPQSPTSPLQDIEMVN